MTAEKPVRIYAVGRPTRPSKPSRDVGRQHRTLKKPFLAAYTLSSPDSDREPRAAREAPEHGPRGPEHGPLRLTRQLRRLRAESRPKSPGPRTPRPPLFGRSTPGSPMQQRPSSSSTAPKRTLLLTAAGLNRPKSRVSS